MNLKVRPVDGGTEWEVYDVSVNITLAMKSYDVRMA